MIAIPSASHAQFAQFLIGKALPPTVYETTWGIKGQVVEVQFGPGHDCGRLTSHSEIDPATGRRSVSGLPTFRGPTQRNPTQPKRSDCVAQNPTHLPARYVFASASSRRSPVLWLHSATNFS